MRDVKTIAQQSPPVSAGGHHCCLMNIIGPSWTRPDHCWGKTIRQMVQYCRGPAQCRTCTQPADIIPSPLLVRLVRVRPRVVDLGHPGDGAEPLAGLSLQLLAVV